MQISSPDVSALAAGSLTAESAVNFKQEVETFDLGVALLRKQMDMAKVQSAQMTEVLETARALGPDHLGRGFDGYA